MISPTELPEEVTSMDALAIVLVLLYLAGWFALRRPWADRRPPVPTLPAASVWLVVAACSLAQLAWPVLGEWGSRDVAAIEHGQWWRLVTSMVLQDGGAVGTVFNLATLAVSLWLLCPVLRGWLMPALFLVAGAVANVLTWLVLGLDGAGNSMATIALVVAGAVLVTRLPRPDGPDLLALKVVPLVLLAGCAGASALLGDNHWLAVLTGAVIGLLGLARSRHASRRREHGDPAPS